MNRRVRSRNKNKNSNRLKVKTKYWLLGVLLIVLIALMASLSFGVKPKYIIAAQLGDNVSVYVLDSTLNEAYEYIIPGDTSVSVARNLGSLKIKNIYELSKNETGDGSLLAETVRNNFYIPVYYWSDGSLVKLIEGNSLQKLQVIFNSENNNLSLKETLHVWWLSLQLKHFQRSEVNLASTSVLKEAVLPDESMGYEIVRELPDSILSTFVYPSTQADEIVLNDVSKDAVQERIGKIALSSGARVALVTNNIDFKNFKCSVAGKSARAKELALVLGCIHADREVQEPFSIEINLGDQFYL